MTKSLFFLIALALFILDFVSADGVAIITHPIPTQIDQVVLQTDDQEIFISGFNDLETQVDEATTVFLELTELANEWEWTAEWINEFNEEVLLISDNHGEEIIIGPNTVTSNAENLGAVAVVTGAANNISEAIDNAENSVEDAANNASENIQDSYNNATDDIHEAVNEVGDNIQDDYNNAVNDVTENIDNHVTDNINDASNSVAEHINDVGDTISSWFGSNNN